MWLADGSAINHTRPIPNNTSPCVVLTSNRKFWMIFLQDTNIDMMVVNPYT